MKKFKKIIVYLVLFVFLFTNVYIFCIASDDDLPPLELFETEPNNTSSTADQTIDDYNNYGTLNTLSDVDWWYVSFDTDGWANYWLKAPSGCDFDLYLYNNNGTLLEASDDSSGRQELIRFDVVANTIYRIEINTASDVSNSNYLFRAKLYETERMYPFVYNHPNDYNSTFSGFNTLNKLYDMGYTGTAYTNNSAATVYSSMPKADIFLFNYHGYEGGGGVVCRTSTAEGSIYAKNSTAYNINQNASLSKIDLAIWMACYSGFTSPTYGNIVDETLNKGAKCVIGWVDKCYVPMSNEWLEVLVNTCSQGETVREGISAANLYLKATYYDNASDITEYMDMILQYYGSSDLDIIIG